MNFGTTYFRIVPKLLNDCLYMFFKLPKNKNAKQLVEELPDEYFSKQVPLPKKFFAIGQSIEQLQIESGPVSFCFLNNAENTMCMFSYTPSLLLENKEFTVEVKDVRGRYGESLIKI